MDNNSQSPANAPDTASPTVYTGLSGNELYCLYLSGYKPGNLVVGNSVYAIGFIGSLASSVRTTVGGEITQFTNMIAEGRRLSVQRLEQELTKNSGHGATGVTSELVFHPGNIEFLSIGSTIFRQDNQQPQNFITSSSDGQEFFCQIDANFYPLRFALGNVAYSIGVGRNLLGELKEMVKGEITQFSNIFNITRNLALQRIAAEAKSFGANSVIGIRTTILPLGETGVQEMVMIGSASYNDKLASIADSVGGIITSDMTAEETWNITRIGYVPLKLILGTSVYSLGVVGGIRAAIHGFVKGELTTLTQMIYGAREESLKKVQQQAEEIGADDVLGIKTYIYQLGGDVIEFLAIGTAVKRVSGISTHTDQLPPQAIIRDKKTFINSADTAFNTNLNKTSVDQQHHSNP
ncbi:MAG TPA: heavy metal-binding domain-containing protein [Candidatus Saccharimonadales bacterium]|nr:heavy metal-binding domain-containing protein [Candidatus Saccharimonadales bacterium]